MARILLVEDCDSVAKTIHEILSVRNHVVEVVGSVDDGLNRILNYHYDLAIIDWHLPDCTGLELCKKYRNNNGKIPVLFLTGNSNIGDKVQALDSGADDYLCKPFSAEELVARTEVLMRRPPPNHQNCFKFGSLEVDSVRRIATVCGEPLLLTAREFKILCLLVGNPDRVYSASSITNKIYDEVPNDIEHAVGERVGCLRKKLAKFGYDKVIVTVRGEGYKFDSGC